MSTTQERIDQLAKASAAANAVVNDPTSNQVTPPSTPLTPPASGGIPSDAQVTPGQGWGQGFGGYIGQTIQDTPSTIVHGLADAVNQTAKTGSDMLDWLDAHGIITKGDPKNPDPNSPAGIAESMLRSRLTPEQNAKRMADQQATLDRVKAGQLIPDSALPKPPITGAGQTIRGIISFGTGLIGSGEVMGPIEGGAGVKMAYGALKGGVAQWFTQDPNGRRLANVIGDNLPFAKVVTDYLSSKPGDSEIEKRVKSAVEGMGLGAAQDVLLAGLKYAKVSRLWSDAAGPAKDALNAEREAAIKNIQDALNKNGVVNTHQNYDGTWTVKANEPARPRMVTAQITTDTGERRSIQTIKTGETANNPVTAELPAGESRPKLKNGGAPLTEAEKAAADAKVKPNAEPVTLQDGTVVPPGGMGTISGDGSQFTERQLADRRAYTRTAKTQRAPDGAVFSSTRPPATAENAGGVFTDEGLRKQFQIPDSISLEDLRKEGIIGSADEGRAGQFTLLQPENLNKYLDAKAPSPVLPKVVPAPQEAPLKFDTQAEAESYAASLNYAAAENNARLTRPTTQITPEQTSALHAQIRDIVSPDNPWLSQSPGVDFNLGKVDTGEQTQAALEAVSTVLRPEIDAARGGAVLTDEQLKNGIADLFGSNGNDTDQVISDLERADVKPNDMPVRMGAGKVMLDNIAVKAMKFSNLLDANPDNPVAAQWLAKNLEDLVRVAEVTKGRITAGARTTAAGRIPLSELKSGTAGLIKDAVQSDADLLSRKFLVALPNMAPEQLQAFARKISLTNGDPATLLQMMDLIKKTSDNELKTPGWIDKMNFIWTAGVLSGPRTTARNLLGNTIALTATPVERVLTGMWAPFTNQFGKGARADSGAIAKEGVDLATGFFTNLQDSVKAASKAFLGDKPIIESGNLTNEIQNPFQGYLGTAVGLPSRALMSQDEFFKNMAYRSFVRAKALRSAAEQGLVGQEATDFVTKQMEDSLANGVALNNNALAFAQEATFTNKLAPGSVGSDLARFTNNHPLFRFAALPFVKTPTNILLWTWDRTPLISLALKSNQQALKAGGERAAEYMARQSTGAVAWGAGVYFASQGMITGAGPKDPVQQKLWLDAGNKPYSLKIDNKYIPYKNADPLLAPFGIIADAVTASGELKAHHEDNIVLAYLTAMSRNLASKSYLFGLTDFMNAAFSGKTNTLNEWFKNRVGSFVPAIANQTNPDGEMREMRTYMDHIIGNIPGLSQTLPAKPTFFGDPVMKAPFTGDLPLNPFSPSPFVKDTHVEQKLLALGRDFSYPSHNYPGTDVDMTDRSWGVKGNLTAYDRMLQLMAHPGDGIPSLKETLGKLVDSDGWDKLSPGVPGIDEGGTQFSKVNALVQKYRNIAMKKVYLEFPELADAVEKSKVTKKVVHKGGQAALDAVTGFLNDSN